MRDPVAEAAQSALGRWSTRAPLPFARTEVSVATLGGKMYLVGGYAQGRVDQPFNQEYVAGAVRALRGNDRHVGPVGGDGASCSSENGSVIVRTFELDCARSVPRYPRSTAKGMRWVKPLHRHGVAVVDVFRYGVCQREDARTTIFRQVAHRRTRQCQAAGSSPAGGRMRAVDQDGSLTG